MTVAAFLKAQAGVLDGRLEAAVCEVVQSSEFQELQARLAKIATDFKDMRNLADTIARKLGIFEAAAEPPRVTSPARSWMSRWRTSRYLD